MEEVKRRRRRSTRQRRTEDEAAEEHAERRVARQQREAAAEHREARLVPAEELHLQVPVAAHVAELRVAARARHVVAPARLLDPHLRIPTKYILTL